MTSRKKVERGVFYTPRPVVSYIVRSVDQLLRTEFGLNDGLADITTWGRNGEAPQEHFTVPKGHLARTRASSKSSIPPRVPARSSSK